jgi:hypothetical protein
MKNAIIIFVLTLALSPMLSADAGILLPRDKQQPDPRVLSLEEMEINIRIDNGDARVFIKQIFANHTNGIEEGNYIFALPSHAAISDFATWDGPTRLPAVILERKRAEDIYTQLKRQAVDPGLLQMGERLRRGAADVGVQRAHRSDSCLRHKAPGNRVSRVNSRREPEIVFRDSDSPGRLSGASRATPASSF